MAQSAAPQPPTGAKIKTLNGAVVRFAGDSGDGMQITGSQFTSTSALLGNDLTTVPDFPAEIRAPAGTLYGVSAFQINFSSDAVFTPGDAPDVLVAMNPAGLKTNLSHLKTGGLLIVNADAFSKANLKKASYDENPLEDDSLNAYHLLSVDIGKQTQAAVKETGLTSKEAGRCKNFWTLGLMYWIYSRPREATIKWLEAKFAKRPDIVKANILALNAGHAYGETIEFSHERYEVPSAKHSPGTYRNISGNQAIAWGFLAAAELSGTEIVLGSYPITPASDVLHELAKYKHHGITTMQAEDEIAAVCTAIGASYAGKIGLTTTSGPGLALKTEGIGLAVCTELPLVVLDVQRAGPSTGLPTKTEQSDLLQAMYGRNGESPLPVIAAYSPGDCFHSAIEAVRIATKYMTPVILLTDGYLGNGAEPWRIPDVDYLPKIEVKKHTDPEGFHPWLRDEETLARVWPIPGTPGTTHRIGGLEKDYNSGNISYDAANHQRMSDVRAAKVAGIAKDIPAQSLELGKENGMLLVLGWGSTFGAIREAVSRCRERGLDVAHAQLKYINPFPENLQSLLAGFDRVLVPEMNMGQLVKVLRSQFMMPIESYAKIEGQPFKIAELETRIRGLMES